MLKIYNIDSHLIRQIKQLEHQINAMYSRIIKFFFVGSADQRFDIIDYADDSPGVFVWNAGSDQWVLCFLVMPVGLVEDQILNSKALLSCLFYMLCFHFCKNNPFRAWMWQGQLSAYSPLVTPSLKFIFIMAQRFSRVGPCLEPDFLVYQSHFQQFCTL